MKLTSRWIWLFLAATVLADEPSVPCDTALPGCEDAIAVESFPFADQGDLACADNGELEWYGCFLVTPEAPVVYYQVTGTGDCFSASTEGSEVDTVLAVYQGSSCFDRSCVGEADDTFLPIYSTHAEVNWLGTLGETYYVAVSAFDSAGTYNLTISVGIFLSRDSRLKVHSRFYRAAARIDPPMMSARMRLSLQSFPRSSMARLQEPRPKALMEETPLRARSWIRIRRPLQRGIASRELGVVCWQR